MGIIFSLSRIPAVILLFAAAIFALTLSGCGKRKPPLPPIAKVSQRVEIAGFQRGNSVILSWQMPETNAPKDDVRHIARIEIYRLAEQPTAPLTMSEAEFAARSLVIASVRVTDDDFGEERYRYTDTLQLAGQPARLRYAVRLVNASGQRAAFSNFLLLEPEARVAAEPTSLTAEVTQDAIVLKWTAPERNVDGSSPVNVAGYNIYRTDSSDRAAVVVNRSLVTETEYLDEEFEFEKGYFYFVRAVSAGTGAERTESSESNIVEVKPVDTFPPTPPDSITIAAAPGAISIFFPPNPERDIAGYRIYRTTNPSLPRSEWELLTPDLLEVTTFEDAKVEKNIEYSYYVVAVDKFGNVSEPSMVVSDRLPGGSSESSESISGVPIPDANPRTDGHELLNAQP
ncbi:MAG TPA: hypothetical protein PKD26_08640 [Pyrinomonadaceae bacterium]|nr:hypothetical protein [Pyrinomonadaceae bacterium]